MRVRATKGLRITAFHGNFSIRGTDLLALPNCHPDASFAVEMVHEDAVLSTGAVSVQAALLYTTSSGERRIRVHTMAVPTSNLVDDVVKAVDIDCLSNILARQALDTALKSGLDAARQRLQTSCIDVLRGSKAGAGMVPGMAGPGVYGVPPGSQAPQQDTPTFPETLQLLPLYTMALQKSPIFRGGSDIRPDERVFQMAKLNVMGVETSRYFIYPRMFALHSLPADACEVTTEPEATTVGKTVRVTVPPMENLSAESLRSDGVFMLENSIDAFVWVGQAARPDVLSALLGVQSLNQVEFGQLQLQRTGTALAAKVDRLIKAIEEDRNCSLQVHLVREGDQASETRFFRYLVDDRASFPDGGRTYSEFMMQISRHAR